MRKWLLAVFAAVIGGAFVIAEAEARRLGGARSTGVQRSVTPATPAKPAQQQAAPQQGQNTAAAQPAASGMSRWAPILGGLAIGGLLGYLFGGDGLLGILLLAALAIVAVMVVRALLARGRAQAPQRMQYAGMGEQTMAAPPPAQASGATMPAARLPAGFDEAGFLKAAKLNFIRLQAANDSGRVEEVREFTTDELFAELQQDIRGGQQTDVVALQADLVDLTTEGGQHWASVRFSGLIREAPGEQAAEFAEVWNLVKPASGAGGWLLAGIQQMH